MYKILEINIMIELGQIIFDLGNQNKTNLIIFRKDRSRKSKLLLIGNLIAYTLIKLTFYLKAQNMLSNVIVT
jgi:hypothetical protein